ncbi:hypothetical protein JZO78_03180 [Enterococcus ureilyticus]|nr:hypothetical protein [Enterococcus ureilyticus]
MILKTISDHGPKSEQTTQENKGTGYARADDDWYKATARSVASIYPTKR